MSTFIVSSVLFVIFAAAGRHLYRQYKIKGSCCSGCAGCPSAGICSGKK